jgi:phenylalanyl-tRNA synthetase alpha chain
VPTYLSPGQLARDIALRDLTDASRGAHAIQALVDIAAGALTGTWGCSYERRPSGDRVVTIADNYNHLGFTAEAVTRDSRYTRYVDEQHMLRSHASALVPAALRALAEDPTDDVLLVCPGIVYRRDAIDRLHTGTPHQLDLWRVSRRPFNTADLDEMSNLLVGALLPGTAWRAEPRTHP